MLGRLPLMLPVLLMEMTLPNKLNTLMRCSVGLCRCGGSEAVIFSPILELPRLCRQLSVLGPVLIAAEQVMSVTLLYLRTSLLGALARLKCVTAHLVTRWNRTVEIPATQLGGILTLCPPRKLTLIRL